MVCVSRRGLKSAEASRMSSSSGGLLELVARGKKDVFFTANPQISFIHSVYKRSAQFTKEIYVAKSRNIPEWGRSVDFDIEHRGDLMNNIFLRIALPVWLPPTVANLNNTSVITDASGVTYGYCNNIGFQMIDKVQFLNDNVLIHEVYGEYLDWRLRMSYDFSTSFLNNDSVGARPETPLAIARSTTRGILRVPIPLLGWQSLDGPGLPLAALRGCRFRIRVHLRPYSAVLTASDGRLSPNPFNMPIYVQTSSTGAPALWPDKTLPASCMKGLDITLESTNCYFSNSVNTWLKAATLRFPFRHVQFQQYTIEDNVMNAVANGADLSIPVKLDFSGPADRLLIGFRSDACGLAGQRNVLIPPVGLDPTYVATMRLNIANIDRVQKWTNAVFREVSSYWKNTRMPLSLTDNTKPDDIYVMSFGGYDNGVPCGTLSFSRAVLPTLYIVPARAMYDMRNISRRTFVLIYAETWNVYEIQNGKERLLFDDS